MARWRSFKVVGLYLALATIWIVASDTILEKIVGLGPRITQVQTLKGLTFVVITSALLFLLIRKEIGKVLYSQGIAQMSTERLNLALQVVNEGVWENNLSDIEHHFFSDQMFRMLGYEPIEHKGTLDWFKDLLHPEDLDAFMSTHEMMINDPRQKDCSLVFRLKAKDGAWRTILSRGKCFERYEDGRAKRIIGTHVDITEQKGIEAKLKHQAQLLGQIHESIVATDRDGFITHVNRAAEILHGCRESEVVGRHFSVLVPDLEPDAFAERVIKELTRNGRIEAEVKMAKCSGEPFWGKLLISPVFDEKGEMAGTVGFSIDVTRQREVEASLQREKQLNEKIIESSVDGIHVFDREFRYRLWNPAMERISGVSKEEALGRVSLDLFPFLKREGVENALQRALEGETVQLQDVFFDVPETGRRGWYDAVYMPIRGEGGSIVAGLALVRDITERKQYEDALRRSEKKYRDLFNNANDGIFCYEITDHGLPGRLIDVNDKACRYLKYSREELLQLHPRDFSGEENWLESISGFFKKLAKEGDITFEWKHLAKDGTIIPVEVSARLFEQEGRTVGISVVRDLTERIEAEKREAHLNGVLRAVRDINQLIIRTRDAGKLIKGVCDCLIGYRGYLTAWVALLNPAPQKNPPIEFVAAAETGLGDKFQPLLQKLKQGELNFCTREAFSTSKPIIILPPKEHCAPCPLIDESRNNACIAIRLEHGERLYGLLSVSMPGDYTINDEELDLITGVAEDIGFALHTIENERKRRQIEIEKQDILQQLYRTQKLEAIGTLAGGIAHDFNNILSAIIGYAELTQLEVHEDPRTRGYLQGILAASARAKGLVSQILTFSRHKKEELKPVQVNLVIQEALRLLRATLPANIQIDQKIFSNAVVMGDPSQLHQVAMNLCTNAYQAMQATGGVLSVGLEDVEVDHSRGDRLIGVESGRYVRLTVADTGHGIPEEIIDSIFDPYFTTKETGEGTGLGLSVVHGIVKEYGGNILVESKAGSGTRFDAYLPVASVESDVPAQLPRDLPSGTERVLFVDDEPALATLGKAILSYLGYRVDVRTSSTEALELIYRNPDAFDLVITDMSMPHMTGDVLAREILKVRPDLPIILCSGYSSQITDEKWKGIGVRAFVLKPLTMTELAEAVRRVLDQA